MLYPLLGTLLVVSMICAVILLAVLAINNVRLNGKIEGFRESLQGGGRHMGGGHGMQQTGRESSSTVAFNVVGGLLATGLIWGGLWLQSL